VKKWQAIKRWQQPVAAVEHLPGDADVPSFVGQHQRPDASQGGEPYGAEHKHQATGTGSEEMLGNRGKKTFHLLLVAG